MAKKSPAKKDTAKVPMTTESMPKGSGGTVFENPVSTTGGSPVYQLDMGESLPPQAKPDK